MKIETIKVGYLETNCYLVIKSDKCIIIDPGDDFESIKNSISSLCLTPLKVLITHNHFDHIGTLLQTLKEYSIEKIDFNDYKNDEEVISIDDFKFKMIHTPGHKSDSITYYFYEDDIMFCGDFIFKNDIGRWDLETGSEDEMYESIKKIKNYPLNTKLYPGHGDSTNLGDEIKYNIYFK